MKSQKACQHAGWRTNKLACCRERVRRERGLPSVSSDSSDEPSPARGVLRSLSSSDDELSDLLARESPSSEDLPAKKRSGAGEEWSEDEGEGEDEVRAVKPSSKRAWREVQELEAMAKYQNFKAEKREAKRASARNEATGPKPASDRTIRALRRDSQRDQLSQQTPDGAEDSESEGDVVTKKTSHQVLREFDEDVSEIFEVTKGDSQTDDDDILFG